MVTLRPRGTAANGRISIDQDSATRGCQIPFEKYHAIYMQQLALQEKMAAQLKDLRADLKRTAEKLEKAHPESESIKHAFRIAFA